jgi:hypothetical protein
VDDATPFERRPEPIELMLCYRYFYNSNEGGNVGGQSTGNVSGFALSTSILGGMIKFPVTMRAVPTIAFARFNNVRQFRQTTSGSTVTAQAPTATGLTTGGWAYIRDTTGTGFTANTGYDYDYSASAEL